MSRRHSILPVCLMAATLLVVPWSHIADGEDAPPLGRTADSDPSISAGDGRPAAWATARDEQDTVRLLRPASWLPRTVAVRMETPDAPFSTLTTRGRNEPRAARRVTLLSQHCLLTV